MSRPPVRHFLPRLIDPRKLASQGMLVKGEITARDLPRLSDAVEGEPSNAQVELSFARDQGGQDRLDGRVDCDVTLVCQRCLLPVAVPLTAQVAVGVVASDEQARMLDRELEPWIVAEESGDLFELIEEELLLALPMIAFHPLERCQGNSRYTTGAVSAEPDENPFQVLKALKFKD